MVPFNLFILHLFEEIVTIVTQSYFCLLFMMTGRFNLKAVMQNTGFLE